MNSLNHGLKLLPHPTTPLLHEPCATYFATLNCTMEFSFIAMPFLCYLKNKKAYLSFKAYL